MLFLLVKLPAKGSIGFFADFLAAGELPGRAFVAG
jgi:hypothetical protein